MMKVPNKSNPKRARIGDIIEISTPAGLGYVQYTHDGGTFGELVRVLPGLHDTRPPDLDKLARLKELYFVFYIMNYALRTGKAKVVSNQPVPEEWANAYPMMRHSAAFDNLGQTTRWRIISAASKLTLPELQNLFLISQLSPEQKRLSIFLTRPHIAMVRELARGWTPERSEELRFKDAAEATKKKQEQGSENSVKEMRHFLYFSKKTDAVKTGERLSSRGFTVEIRGGAGGEKWLVLATKALSKTMEQMDELRDEMESLAIQFSGEYDGWEAPLESLGSGDVAIGHRPN